MPLPNVEKRPLAKLVQFCEKRVAEAAAAQGRKSIDVPRLTSDVKAARRLADETAKDLAAASAREQRLGAAAAEAHRLAAEATELHVAAAEEAEHLAAEADKTERLAAAAEAALQQLVGSTTAEPGARAVLGGDEPFAKWEHAFIAQTEKRELLQLIMVRALTPSAVSMSR